MKKYGLGDFPAVRKTKVEKYHQIGRQRLRGRIFKTNLGFYKDYGVSTKFEEQKRRWGKWRWRRQNATMGAKAIFISNVDMGMGKKYSIVMNSQKRSQYDNYVSTRTWGAGIKISNAPISRELFNRNNYHFSINTGNIPLMEELFNIRNLSGAIEAWNSLGKVINKSMPFDISGWVNLGCDGCIGISRGDRHSVYFKCITKDNVTGQLIMAENGKPYVISW